MRKYILNIVILILVTSMLWSCGGTVEQGDSDQSAFYGTVGAVISLAGITSVIQYYNYYNDRCSDIESYNFVAREKNYKLEYNVLWQLILYSLDNMSINFETDKNNGEIITKWKLINEPSTFAKAFGVTSCDFQWKISVIKISNFLTMIKVEPIVRANGQIFAYTVKNIKIDKSINNYSLNLFWQQLDSLIQIYTANKENQNRH